MANAAQISSEFHFDEEGGLAHTPDAAALALNTNVIRFKAGETLYMEGEAAPFCYQVVSGIVKEYNTLEDGRRQVADFYGVGEMLGLSEMEVQLHTAEAITECAVRCYGRDQFLKTVASSPDLSRKFLEALMGRLHRTRERMVMLGRMCAIQRVAVFLLRLSQEQNTINDIRFQMSRQDIADHLGLTTETVCRALTEMKKRGVLVFETARLFSIHDARMLHEIASKSA